MYNGVIIVDKEKGYTSHDVVAKLRGILHMKKIGHTGTLDPDATGVLPVCLGNATKVCDMLTDSTKTYEAVMKLGIVTDSQDMTGKVLESFNGVYPDARTIKEAIASFVGEYDQIPPMYSALKVNGKKLYELARAGVEVERKPRKVVIGSIIAGEPDEVNHTVTMTVECSKGTYIRTLCHDIGQALGCGACMESLIRTRVGAFSKNNALKLDDIVKLRDEEKLDDIIVSVEDVFSKLRAIHTTYDKRLDNGNKLKISEVKADFKQADDKELVRAYNSKGEFAAVYMYNAAAREYKPYKMFNTITK